MAWVLCICILAALLAQISCLELAWHDGINPHWTFNIPVLAVSRGPSEKGCCMIWLPLKPLQRSKALGTWSFSNFQQQKSETAKTSCHFFRPADFTKADMHFWDLPIVNSRKEKNASYRFPVQARVPPCLAAARATRSPTNRSAAKVTWRGYASSILVVGLETWNGLSWIDVLESGLIYTLIYIL